MLNGQRTPARRTRRAALAGALTAALIGGVLAAPTPTAAAAPGAPGAAAPAVAPAADRTGLRADYFTITDTDTFALDDANLTVSVLDEDIDVDDMVPVYSATTGRTENVGVRWTGTVTAPTTGDYTFSAIGDNGFRLWVGDDAVAGGSADQLIEWWVNEWDKEQTATRAVHLEAGAPIPFRFEQFQNIGGANVHLRWASADAGVAKQAVPASAFAPPADFTPYDVGATVAVAGNSVGMTFPADVSGTEGLAEHLRIVVDGTDYPVTGFAADGATLTAQLGAAILEGSYVRVAYDGRGALTAGGEAVPAFNALADNTSTYALSTPWADDVDADAPLPEYPRPQLTRSAWKNLNGKWDFAPLEKGDSPVPSSWNETVVVPYPIESRLSGIERHEDHFAYRRTFTVPKSWNVLRSEHSAAKKRLQLNFGAVDHDATVMVNGKIVTEHQGGFDAFSADITDVLRPGSNELVVRVTDTTGNTPKGKQSADPSGIFYTAASGIWQTVWMEPVVAAHIQQLKTTPVLSSKGDSITTTVKTAGASARSLVAVSAYDERGRRVATTIGKPGAPLTLKLGRSHRWTPDDPYLYHLKASLVDVGGRSLDRVGGYVGVRSIGIEKIDGVNRIVLNGERTFLLSTLDQGYWPDGVYTAPTDKALAWDVQETKDLGFNTIRKHIKVEPQRWYYHADQIGMMVWQDMPAAFTGRNAESTSKPVTDNWERELKAMIDQFGSTTSIIGWIPFNEGWSEWDLDATARVAGDIKKQDPSRLLNTHSGVNCCQSLGDSGTGDIIDHHAYTGPASPDPNATRAAIDGEHGGFSLSILGHTWPGGSVNPYGEVASSQELTSAYVGNTSRLIGLAREKLSGSVYTQLTDVEGEVNGFWTYDRRVSKMDRNRVRAINLEVIAAGAGKPAPTGSRKPVAGWNFDRLDGTSTPGIEKRSPAAEVLGGATLTEGVHGSAVSLDGVDDQVTATVPRLDTAADYSVSAWVRMDTVPDNYATAIAADGLEGTSPFFLQYSGIAGGWAMSFAEGPRAIAPKPAEPGSWHHLVGVRDADAGTVALYLDGVKAATEKSWSTPASTGLLTIGRGQYQDQAVDFLDGAVDDVRVFDRALTDRDVQRLSVRS